VPSLSKHSSNSPVVVLVNPAAGGGRAKKAVPSLRQFAERNHWNVEFHITASPEDLAMQARQAATEGARQILALGGDGTFQSLLNSLHTPSDVVLGILPAGAGNDLAASLGLPADPVKSAALLMNGEIHHLDAARVRTAEGNERLYTGGGGVGLDADAVRYATSTYRNLRGRSRYLLAALRALAGFRPLRVRAQFQAGGAKSLEANVLLVGVLNTPSYGAGLRLAPAAKTNDGNLDLVVLESLALFEILALLPSLAASGELRTRRVHRFPVQQVRIETDRPCLFHGDGEILGSTPVEISVVPRAIRMLCPAVGEPCESSNKTAVE
jgi:diacylglycerol kinase (ATP)